MHKNKPKIYWGLWPVSMLYGIGASIRNKLFDWGMLRSRSFPFPLICIGNLTVGGTGKTPHTEYLIRLLKKEFKVAALSRGYKRETKGFVLASSSSTAAEIGDEPFQMARKFPDITVAVDADRCEGINLIQEKCPATEVILLDDAFQHRYVTPGLSVLLTDYNRPIYEDQLLPAGRLRETRNGKKRADMIIVTKCPAGLSDTEQESIKRKLQPHSGQEVLFTTMKYGKLQPLFANAAERSLDSLKKQEEILLLTGIASPDGLAKTLRTHCDKVRLLAFPDHHAFDRQDLQKLERMFGQLTADRRLIVTTEKDAARLRMHQLSNVLKESIHTLPIEVEFINKQETIFNQKIIEYVRKNSRNSSIHQS